MTTTTRNLPYIHGFSPSEQERLYAQAAFAEALVYGEVDFSGARQVLEIGSGVGAQTAILLRRFPELQLNCIEINPRQIAAAQHYLAQLPTAQGRYTISTMNARQLSFGEARFDGVFICWVLEHLKEQGEVLRQAHRVLQPGGQLYVTEVLNSQFFLDPYSPAIWKYWMAFNDYQYDHYGDPFVGAKLGNLLLAQGFSSIRTTVKYWYLDDRFPEERQVAISMWKELLLSAEETLISNALVSQDLVKEVKREFLLVEQQPQQTVFIDAFVQARATK